MEGLAPSSNGHLCRAERGSAVGYGHSGAGFTLLEALIGLGILAIVSVAIYQGYGSVLDIVQSAQYNTAALSIIETQIEVVRNMRYEDVGVVGGIPAGTLPASSSVTLGGVPFTLNASVRNVDDPFDGTAGGSPDDPSPADYKLVQFAVTCDTCPRYRVISMATYVAPKNLENPSLNGVLAISVFDAEGFPVSGATVRITNSSVSPPVSITDTTDAAGLLQLYDVATSSAGYRVVVSKSGYSTDRTYSPADVANPLKPDLTVAEQQLTLASFAIDRVSTLALTARDSRCRGASAMDVRMAGTKLIGTAPDVPKFQQDAVTDGTGTLTFADLEWDSYTLSPMDPVWDIAGIIATASIQPIVDPNTSHAILWQVASRSGNGLLISVADDAGNLLNDATVRVTGSPSYDRTVVTGALSEGQDDWTGDAYDSQSGGISAGTDLALSDPLVPHSEWLISDTFDLGTSSVDFRELMWDPSGQPAGTSVSLQFAANDTGSGWEFVGPDGTSATSFTSPGQDIPASLDGKRYVRYRVVLANSIPSANPGIDAVSFSFTSGCAIPGQAYFNGLGNGTYTVEISRSGYQQSSTTKDVAASWQRHTVTLLP